MKKSKNHLFLLLAAMFVVAIIGSCKKSSSSNSSAITKENIAGSYMLTGVTVTVPPFPAQSVLDSVPSCQRDDIIKLNTDLTMQNIDAGTKCVPPSDFTSTWSLSGTAITVDTLSGTVKSFNGKVLVIESPVTFNNISGTTDVTFTKQ
ncbi:MAG: hypothetical protein JST75_14445 [Bacteroidetes bacterium]|nr:hypothetical protein [Bacteroidota bacterium]